MFWGFGLGFGWLSLAGGLAAAPSNCAGTRAVFGPRSSAFMPNISAKTPSVPTTDVQRPTMSPSGIPGARRRSRHRHLLRLNPALVDHFDQLLGEDATVDHDRHHAVRASRR